MLLRNSFIYCAIFISVAAAAKPEESFSDKDCMKARGESITLRKKVAEGVRAPESTVKFEGAFIGGPLSGCAGLFSTPKGPYECVVSAWTTDGGRSFFIGPPSAALVGDMSNLCRKAK